MPKPVSLLSVLLMLGGTCIARAGELRLDNGAILPGELGSVSPKTLVWKADRIGDVTVAKSDVIDLQTSQRASLQVMVAPSLT